MKRSFDPTLRSGSIRLRSTQRQHTCTTKDARDRCGAQLGGVWLHQTRVISGVLFPRSVTSLAMRWSSSLRPISAKVQTVSPGSAVDWHPHQHAAICLIEEGTLVAQHAGRRFSSAPGTLLLLAPNEGAGFSNHKSTSARLLVLNFRVGSAHGRNSGPLSSLPPTSGLSQFHPASSVFFCDFLFKIAFEQGISSPVFPGSGTAASAWLAIALTSVMRWIFASRGATQLPEVAGEVDRACFDLWRTIHRHAHQGNAAEPMLLSQNPHTTRCDIVFGSSSVFLLIPCWFASAWSEGRICCAPATSQSKKSPRRLDTADSMNSLGLFAVTLA